MAERKRRGRLGPHDVFRPTADGVPRHRQIGREDPPRRLRRRRHLVLLRDVALDQPDADGRPSRVSDPSATRQDAPRRDPDQNDRRCANGRPSRAPCAEQRKRDRRVDERDKRGEAVDTEHARQLRDRQHGDLAVAKRHPRKAAEQEALEDIQSRPTPPARRTAPIGRRARSTTRAPSP